MYEGVGYGGMKVWRYGGMDVWRYGCMEVFRYRGMAVLILRIMIPTSSFIVLILRLQQFVYASGGTEFDSRIEPCLLVDLVRVATMLLRLRLRLPTRLRRKTTFFSRDPESLKQEVAAIAVDDSSPDEEATPHEKVAAPPAPTPTTPAPNAAPATPTLEPTHTAADETLQSWFNELVASGGPPSKATITEDVASGTLKKTRPESCGKFEDCAGRA